MVCAWQLGSFLPEMPSTAKKGLLKIWQKFLDSEEGIGLGLSDFIGSSQSARPARQREFE